MIKVECTNWDYIGDGEFWDCKYRLKKHRWEHIVNALYKQGGHAGNNTCPRCGGNTLSFDYGEGKPCQ